MRCAGTPHAAPGRATAEWVQRHLSDVTGRVLRVPAHPSTQVPATGALPGGGRMLAVNEQGLFAFGLGGAPRQLLGRIDAAAWSPHGRYAGWSLLHLKGRGLDRNRTLATGRDAQLAGWCCR